MGRKRTKDKHKSKKHTENTIGDKRLMPVYEGSNEVKYKLRTP